MPQLSSHSTKSVNGGAVDEVLEARELEMLEPGSREESKQTPNPPGVKPRLKETKDEKISRKISNNVIDTENV